MIWQIQAYWLVHQLVSVFVVPDSRLKVYFQACLFDHHGFYTRESFLLLSFNHDVNPPDGFKFLKVRAILLRSCVLKERVGFDWEGECRLVNVFRVTVVVSDGNIFWVDLMQRKHSAIHVLIFEYVTKRFGQYKGQIIQLLNRNHKIFHGFFSIACATYFFHSFSISTYPKIKTHIPCIHALMWIGAILSSKKHKPCFRFLFFILTKTNPLWFNQTTINRFYVTWSYKL